MTQIRVAYLDGSKDDIVFSEQSQRLRQLRLDSLLKDPESFSSKHADEISQPTEFWHTRFRDKHAHHWIAIDGRGDEDENLLQDNKWVGFLVITEESQKEIPFAHDTASMSDGQSHNTYAMAAVYVDSSYRGRGICTGLIKAAIEWISEQTRTANLSKSFLTTQVRAGNSNAKRLYINLGFVQIKEDVIVGKSGEQHPSYFLGLEIKP